jgi:hypothetical protein
MPVEHPLMSTTEFGFMGCPSGYSCYLIFGGDSIICIGTYRIEMLISKHFYHAGLSINFADFPACI